VPARILLVDDQPDIRALCRLRLQREGYEVVDEATTGREAIAAAVAHEPDVIVLDVMMPEMTGLEALPELVRAVPEARILVFSSLTSLTLAEVRRLGGHALLEKVDQFQLTDVVAELLASRDGQTLK
jgi:CheY-like chemotaxis protein